MSKRILFAVNGFGMGNATRCDALSALLSEDFNADFITSDRALEYFRASGCNTYPQKKISSGKSEKFGSLLFFIKFIPEFFGRILANFLIQRRLIVKNKYDYVVFDSDYSFVLHRIFGTKTVLLGLNNSYEVLNYFIKKPASLRVSLIPSFIVECLDFCVYSIFCRHVICPSIKPEALKPLFGKFLISPLLVRAQLMKAPRPEKTSGVIVMASSSLAQSPISQLKTQAFSTNNLQQLQESLAVICNAGQSSISECLYLEKPALVIPIPRHAEQFVNAELAAEKGLQKSDVLTKIDFRFAKHSRFQFDYSTTSGIVKNHFHHIEGALHDQMR